jgi:hypothetical protein
MEIKNFNVKELSHEELLHINGGSKIGDALRAVWNAICTAAEWVVYKVEEWYYAKREEYINSIKDGVYPDSSEW